MLIIATCLERFRLEKVGNEDFTIVDSKVVRVYVTVNMTCVTVQLSHSFKHSKANL